LKKFLINILIFIIPFGILWVITYFTYSTDKGDLIRIGYIPNLFPNYRDKFEKELSREIKFEKLSNNPIKREYDILTIGDSFSEQGAAGYQNLLASMHGKSVLHIDNSYHSNPFQALIALQNGDFFEEFKIKNVILEVVERHFIQNSMELKIDSSMNYNSFQPIKSKNVEDEEVDKVLNQLLKFPYFTLYRKIFPDKLISLVYARELKNNPFSLSDNTLYFYHLDVANIALNNSMDELENINSLLNDLNTDLDNSGTNLIVFPVPDKYHFYKDDLENTDGFDTPLLFSNFAKLQKEYAYVDLMDSKDKGELDMLDFYYYDDSHWSPEGAKEVTQQLVRVIDN
tara:strand:- start:22036 stop:23061 length:1026 start_codon:yes stop_codon:yes gene_type:complete